MKTKITILLMLLISITTFAQQGINYKAIIKDGSGNAVTTPITVQFIIYKGAALTNNVYQETHNTTPNVNGLAILNIGTGTVDSGIFTDIDWASNNHFLNVQIDTGAGLVDMGTTEFMAVPYAKHSKTSEAAENVTGLEQITEGGNTGWRLKDRPPLSYGNIGDNATDLSFSNLFSTTRGATGSYSVAMGYYTTASGYNSTAMGNNTTASGDYSNSVGFHIKTEASYSTALGRYNIGGGNTTTWTETDPLFEIGNGLDNSNRNNALTILKNGTITAPSFDLAEITDNKALITKEYADTNLISSGLEQLTEGGSTGWRLVGHNPLEYGNIGGRAIDLSNNANLGITGTEGATGLESFATGVLTTASGLNSTAMGVSTTASGANSVAMGLTTTASGNRSTAMGHGTKAEALDCIAIGRYNIGGGNPSFISPSAPLFEIGNGAGENTRHNALTILRNGKIGVGRNTPSSLFEVEHQNGTPTAANLTNAFSIRNISNGESWQFYSHLDGYLELYRNGVHKGSFNATTGAYNIVSDRRLKKNITSLDSNTLQKLMQLNPVSYLMTDQKDNKLNIGLISQEVKEIFPSLTRYAKEQDILTLSYTELIPILIKSIQEQQEIIGNQNEKYESLLKRIEQLEKN